MKRATELKIMLVHVKVNHGKECDTNNRKQKTTCIELQRSVIIIAGCALTGSMCTQPRPRPMERFNTFRQVFGLHDETLNSP